MATDLIPDAGGCIVSENVWNQTAPVRWLVREESVNDVDNGWRVWSALDDSDYLDNPDNLRVADYNDVCALEPLMVAVYHFPVGSDLQIVDDGGRRILVTADGQEVPRELYYVPPAPGQIS